MNFSDWASVTLFIGVSLFVLLHPTARGIVREMPSFYADRIDRWRLRQHSPFDASGDGTGPAICLLCKKDWPCDQFIDVDRRIDQRINGGAP